MTRIQLMVVASVAAISMVFAMRSTAAPEATRPAPVVVTRSPDVALVREVENLRADMRDLQNAQDNLYDDLAATPSTDVVPVEDGAEVKTVEQTRMFMDQVIVAEAADAQWSSDAENRISEQFTEQAPEGAQLVETRCRTTLCRVEVALSTTAAAGSDEKALRALNAWNSDGFFVSEVGPPWRLVAYVAREGIPLPTP